MEWINVVDLIEYLEKIDNQMAGFSILTIMILQSPILTFSGYLLMIYSGFRFGLITGTLINFLGILLIKLKKLLDFIFGK